MVRTLLVSFNDEGDILLVGEKDKGQAVEIVNAFAGEKAKVLFDYLIGGNDHEMTADQARAIFKAIYPGAFSKIQEDENNE